MTWSGFSENGQGSAERGPGTYTLRLPGVPVAQARPTERGAPQVGVRGGQVSTSNRISTGGGVATANIQQLSQLPEMRVQRDPTADLLFRLGGERAQQLVQKAEQEQFIIGASKAAAGQAMVEIANDKPWYSRIFGDTALVEGARAYIVKAGVAGWASSHLANMDKLAEKSPDEVPSYISASLEAVMTGDPATDQALRAEALAQVPGIIKEHTRQHYLFAQKRAAAARDSAFDAMFSKQQARYTNSIGMSVEESDAFDMEVAQTLVPAPGVNVEEHWAAVVDRASVAIQNGNTWAFGLLATEGVIEQLPPDQAFKLTQAMRRAAPQALGKAATAMIEDLHDLNTVSRTPAQIRERMAELNAQAAGMSGVPPELAELFSTDTMLKYMNAADRDIARQTAAVDRATQEAAAAEIQRQVIASAWMSFDPAKLDGATIIPGSKKDKDTVAEQLLRGMSPAQRGEFIGRWADAGREIPYAKALYAGEVAELRKETIDLPRVAGLINEYSRMPEAARKMYFTTDENLDLAAVEAGYQSTGNMEAAISSRAVYKRLLKEQLPDEVHVKDQVGAAVRELIEERFESGLFKSIGAMFTGQQVYDSSPTDRRYLEALVVDQERRGGTASPDPKVRAKGALKALEAQGAFSMVGGRPIFNVDPQSALREPAIHERMQGLGGQRDDVAASLGITLDRVATASGMDPSNRLVLQMPAAPGKPLVYQIIGWTEDGDERYAYVTEEMVRAEYAAAVSLAEHAQKYGVGAASAIQQQRDLEAGLASQ
jgi:hypothetical protein